MSINSLCYLSLAIIFLLPLVYPITVRLPEKGVPLCFWKDLEEEERFIGSYVVSGKSETGVYVFVNSPKDGKVLFTNEEEREGYWDVKVEQAGEHRICFRNVQKGENYLSLVLYGDAEIDALVNSTTVTTDSIDQVGFSLNETFFHLREITDNLNFQRTRGTVHFNHLEALDSKITWSVFFKVVVLVAIASAQIYVLTGLFKSKSRNFV